MARRPEAPQQPWWEPAAASVAVDTADTAGRAGDADAGGAAPEGAVLLARADGDSVRVAMATAADSAGAAAARPDSVAAAAKRPVPAARPTREATPVVAPEVSAARRAGWAARDRQERERVRDVNEYALWCVEQGLWGEARRHLEQAIAGDSLAASLHNNLAIVYEQQGERRQARRHYALAADLNPGRELYRTNLQRLERALEHRPPAADSLANDAALLPPPRGGYRPDEEGGTSRAEGQP